jgi:predicted MFS family arabinose efflux permease
MTSTKEKGLLWLLAAVQFAHVVDFMILMPLGPGFMRMWSMEPAAFNRLVSVYTVVAGVSGLLAAPWMDRFDRRPMLLLFHGAFSVASCACACAQTPLQLLVARGFSGLAGGLAGTTVMAIVGDVVPPSRRGEAMGILTTAFSAAAALGVPIGLYMARALGWQAPFVMLGLLVMANGLLLARMLPPVRAHLEHPRPVSGLRALLGLLRQPPVGRGLAFMAVLVFGHFAIIPLLAPHLVGDLGLPEAAVPLVYLVGGVASAWTGPWLGRLSDRLGRRRVFGWLVLAAIPLTLAIALPGALPPWLVVLLAGSYFVFGSGRFVPAQALLSTVVMARDRGAFMSLASCVRDLAGGLSATLGGALVARTASGGLQHFGRLGWMAAAAALVTLWLVRTLRHAEEPPRAGSAP